MTESPFLRRLSAVALVLCPLLYGVTRFTWPAGSDGSTARQVAGAAAHPMAWYLSATLEGLSGLTALVGALCFALVVTGRGAVLARIALGFAVCAGVGFVVNWAINAVLVAQAGRLPLARATSAYAAILHRGYIAPFVVILVVATPWSLFLVLAAVRHGLVSWWVVAVLVVTVVGGAALPAAPIAAVPLLVQMVVAGLIGRALIAAPASVREREPVPA